MGDGIREIVRGGVWFTRSHAMKRKKHKPHQIVEKLRVVERLQQEGKTLEEAAVEIDVSVQTYYRWRRQYGAMGTNELKKLKGLEQENRRLKKLVAELALQNDILKEVNVGNF